MPATGIPPSSREGNSATGRLISDWARSCCAATLHWRQAWGCTGGKMEKETEGSGYFEVDDAKCRDGQYDIKLDKDFKVTVMTIEPALIDGLPQ
jgi:hypothetical protein